MTKFNQKFLFVISLVSFISAHNYTLDIRMGDHVIPINTTTIYLCKMFNVSELIPKDERNQTLKLTKMEAILTSKRVHHIMLMGCLPGTQINETERCEHEMSKNCTLALGAFAPGNYELEFPKETGIDFNIGRTEVVLMQIHYHNPTRTEFVDTSGLRLHYTDHPRPYSVGTTIIGKDIIDFSIPPNTKNFTITDSCNSTCTNMLGNEGFQLIGAFLHGHWFLKRIRLSIKYSNGTIDDTTFRDNNYSFNTQYFKLLPKPINIKPGDSLTTICEYDTSKTNRTVFGGLGSDDEMCFGMLLYYNASDGFVICGESYGCLPYFFPPLSHNSTNSFLGH